MADPFDEYYERIKGQANYFSSGHHAAPDGDPSTAAWQAANLETIKLGTGKDGKPLVIRVYKEAAPAFRGFVEDLKATGYDIRNLGSQNYRPKRNGHGLSEHSYGTAIDINGEIIPGENGPRNAYSKTLTTDLPANVSQMAAKWGLSWGGDWDGVKDAMHFEYTGIAPYGHPIPPANIPDGEIAAPTGAPGTYRVKVGDNLTRVAQQFGTTLEALAAANGITDPNRLRAGADLKIPGGSDSAIGGINTMLAGNEAPADATTAIGYAPTRALPPLPRPRPPISPLGMTAPPTQAQQQALRDPRLAPTPSPMAKLTGAEPIPANGGYNSGDMDWDAYYGATLPRPASPAPRANPPTVRPPAAPRTTLAGLNVGELMPPVNPNVATEQGAANTAAARMRARIDAALQPATIQQAAYTSSPRPAASPRPTVVDAPMPSGLPIASSLPTTFTGGNTVDLASRDPARFDTSPQAFFPQGKETIGYKVPRDSYPTVKAYDVAPKPTQAQLQAMRNPRLLQPRPIVRPGSFTPMPGVTRVAGDVDNAQPLPADYRPQIAGPKPIVPMPTVPPATGRTWADFRKPSPLPPPAQLQPTIQPRPVGSVAPDPMPRFARPGGYPMIADPPTGSTPIADLVNQLNSPGAQFLTWLNNESLEGRRRPIIRAVTGLPQIPRPGNMTSSSSGLFGGGGLFGNNARRGTAAGVAAVPGMGAVRPASQIQTNPYVVDAGGTRRYYNADEGLTEIQSMLISGSTPRGSTTSTSRRR